LGREPAGGLRRRVEMTGGTREVAGLAYRDIHRDLAEDPWLRQVGNLTSASQSDLPLGCWLVTPRRGYRHHGVYAGNGLVIHYAGLSRSWRRGPVEVVSLSEFSLGECLWARWTPAARHAGPPAVRRALSRLGEDAYRILTNNCEHFCAWCVEGDSRSLQVERWLAWPRAIVRATVTRIAQAIAPIGAAPRHRVRLEQRV